MLTCPNNKEVYGKIMRLLPMAMFPTDYYFPVGKISYIIGESATLFSCF